MMARFFTALIFVMAVAIGSTFAQLQTAGNQKQQQPKLLTLEQQQELLEQLATLQRQTQLLLQQQQSLAAAAAAAGVTPQSIQQAAAGQQPSSSIQSSPASTSSTPRQSSSSSVVFSRGPQSNSGSSSAQLQNAPTSQQQASSKPNKVTNPKSTTHSSSSQHHQHQHQQQQQPSSSRSQQPPLPAGPQINWGKCPELEPSESEKMSKAGVITKCLETTPLPGNITRESVEQHREQIAACALRAEGWFTSNGNYDYGKAEKEIKNKRLQKELEVQVLSYHSQCKAESEEKYPSSSSSIIAQIQLYQACMDYFISDVCGIEVNEANDHAGSPQFN